MEGVTSHFVQLQVELGCPPLRAVPLRMSTPEVIRSFSLFFSTITPPANATSRCSSCFGSLTIKGVTAAVVVVPSAVVVVAAAVVVTAAVTAAVVIVAAAVVVTAAVAAAVVVVAAIFVVTVAAAAAAVVADGVIVIALVVAVVFAISSLIVETWVVPSTWNDSLKEL
uniref:ABC transmembrane type-1 domain-containing protein n=1 Tax=Angiostrongylus cantonensis TaxID=6313 RepID=A0A0K0DA60_ANGCA